jgi:hypothetical protein
LRTGGLSFDGVDDYVWIPHTASQDLKTALSLAVWVYRAGAITEWIINKNYDSIGNTQYGFYIDPSNNIQFVLNGAGRVSYGINILGRWAHIVCTWDGSTACIYVDGQLKSSASYSATLTSQPYAITIGCRKTTGGVAGAFFHKGPLDKVRIYNRALSGAEIQDVYNGNFIKDGLVLCFDMTEYEGSTLYDKSGYGNDGTIYGATWVIKKQGRVLPSSRVLAAAR